MKQTFDDGDVFDGYLCINDSTANEENDCLEVHQEPCNDIGTTQQCDGCRGELNLKLGVIKCTNKFPALNTKAMMGNPCNEILIDENP